MSLPPNVSPEDLILVNTNYRFEDDHHFTNLNVLENNDFVDSTSAIIIAMILYIKMPDKTGSKVALFGRNKQSLPAMSYTRMIVCMDLLAPHGANLFSVLMGSNR